jgi:hypothetical protein
MMAKLYSAHPPVLIINLMFSAVDDRLVTSLILPMQRSAIAEKLNITRVDTLDRRGFSILRPSHCDFFDLCRMHGEFAQ